MKLGRLVITFLCIVQAAIALSLVFAGRVELGWFLYSGSLAGGYILLTGGSFRRRMNEV